VSLQFPEMKQTRGRPRNPTTSTNATAQPFSAKDMLAAIEALKPPEDPLNGATTLWVHSTDNKAIEVAREIRKASGDQVHVQETPNGHRGFIYGFKGASFMPCVRIKLEGNENGHPIS